MTKTAAEVQCLLTANQVLYRGAKAQNGKRYVEAQTGSVEIGTEVVAYTAENIRRGGVIPERLEVIGKVTEAGKSFLATTKEAGILSGSKEACDVYNTRYYID